MNKCFCRISGRSSCLLLAELRYKDLFSCFHHSEGTRAGFRLKLCSFCLLTKLESSFLSRKQTKRSGDFCRSPKILSSPKKARLRGYLASVFTQIFSLFCVKRFNFFEFLSVSSKTFKFLSHIFLGSSIIKMNCYFSYFFMTFKKQSW